MGIAHEGGRGGQSRDGGIEAHGEKQRKEGKRTAQARGAWGGNNDLEKRKRSRGYITATRTGEGPGGLFMAAPQWGLAWP